ncbi:MAG: M90 family metallopeptidase [Pseudomonadota bacterium]
MFRWLRDRRRRALAAQPTPPAWSGWLEHRVPFFERLSPEGRARFLELLRIFVGEHRFVGAGGLTVTEEMKVVVGACAVRLILHLDLSLYDGVTEIVIYPQRTLVDPKDGTRFLGQAHHHGAVILCWPAVLDGLKRAHDGHDTALHEFAHALDLADGSFDGAPPLRAAEDYGPWAQVLGKHFERLQRQHSPVLRDYGATNPAEFFAVASEAFFEKGDALRRTSPDLYAALARFYRGA